MHFASLAMFFVIRSIEINNFSSIFEIILVGSLIYFSITLFINCYTKKEIKDILSLLVANH